MIKSSCNNYITHSSWNVHCNEILGIMIKKTKKRLHTKQFRSMTREVNNNYISHVINLSN